MGSFSWFDSRTCTKHIGLGLKLVLRNREVAVVTFMRGKCLHNLRIRVNLNSPTPVPSIVIFILLEPRRSIPVRRTIPISIIYVVCVIALNTLKGFNVLISHTPT